MNLKRYGIDLKHIPMEDHPDFAISVNEEIEPCIEYVEQGMKKKEGTLVICTAGRSRSATVCIAYLMKTSKMSFKEAFGLVKKARPFIDPNKGFLNFL